jgi:diadenosine tetraphosphate (Ap4A) HIT family hydrolase
MSSLPVTSTEDVIDQPARRQFEAFLDEHRRELNDCLDGLTEEQARRSLVPSRTTLLGLVKHATFVEKVWFDEAVTGRPRAEIGIPATPDETFILDDGGTIATKQADKAPRDRASLRTMALRPEEFYDHALAAADGERRLPLARMTGWDISPFEPDGLRVAPLRPPVLPEPARHGEDPADCSGCRAKDEGVWLDDRWRLSRITNVGVPLVLMLHPRDHYDLADLPDELAAELGLLTTHVVRHIQALPHISRAHVYRIGDGAAHLHVWFFARPEGQAQLYGSWMVIWDDLLPEYPEDAAEADAAIVAESLAASYGGRCPAASEQRT